MSNFSFPPFYATNKLLFCFALQQGFKGGVRMKNRVDAMGLLALILQMHLSGMLQHKVCEIHREGCVWPQLAQTCTGQSLSTNPVFRSYSSIFSSSCRSKPCTNPWIDLSCDLTCNLWFRNMNLFLKHLDKDQYSSHTFLFSNYKFLTGQKYRSVTKRLAARTVLVTDFVFASYYRKLFNPEIF